MNFLQRNFKKSKKLFTAIFVILIIFIMAIPSFAADKHYNYVTSINLNSDTHYSGNASDYADIEWSRVGGTNTKILNKGSSYKVPVIFYSPSNWVAGQSYRIEFLFSASNIDGMSVCLSTTQKLTEGEQLYIVNDNPAAIDKDYNYTFVYSGQPYLIFTFIMPAKSSCVISDIDVFAYNPNAELESQNQEIIEQNSELNSKLFDEGETFEFTEPDMSEQYSRFQSGTDDLNDRVSKFVLTDRIRNGIKAFASFFTLTLDALNSNPNTSIFEPLMYFSVFIGLLTLLYGVIKDGGLRK